MTTIIKDLKFAIRTMVKKPGFALTAICTLALGIGASTAIFTVVDAALLRGLPYRSPDQLYHLWEKRPQEEFGQREFSYPDYQDYQRNTSMELAAYTGGAGIMTGRGEAERVFSPSASANFFSVLGVDAFIGRTFLQGEDKPGTPRVAVLTYGMWQRRFGSDRGILNQSITISGQNYTVVGVLPPSFEFPLRNADLWVPYQPTENQLTRRFMHGTNVIGRLREGATQEQALSELSVIAQRIEQEHNQSHAGTGMRLLTLQEQFIGDVKPILFVLLGAVGFVLLIACANVASLLLTRALSRHKEVAIRAALGASGWRVIRQMLTESVLLSVVGGLAGLIVAYWALQALVAALPDQQINALPFLKSLNLDTRILAFSFALSAFTGILFGLVPALQSLRVDLNETLKEGGRMTSGGTRQRLRSVFVVSEIALAVVLLVGAGLMLKSLSRLLESNVGFNPDSVLTMTIALPMAQYPEPSQVVAFHQQLTERLASLPGVEATGTVNILPLQGGNTTRFYVDGDPIHTEANPIEANIRVTNESYFQTLGVPLVGGRGFDLRDANIAADSPGVILISKTTADRVFPNGDAVGKRLRYSSFDGPGDVIVGVVGDVKIGALDEALRPVIYYPFRRFPSVFANLVVRTASEPGAFAGSLRTELKSIEPGLAIFNVRTMNDLISNSPAAFMRRFPGMLITVFAAVAMLLAAIGIYGVVSYSVSQQSHYIGVRMALGARASDILKLVLKQGLTLALAGVVIGVISSLLLMRLLRTLLFEVQTTDPLILVVVVSVLFSVALLACYIPARRATKVDPLEALRYE